MRRLLPFSILIISFLLLPMGQVILANGQHSHENRIQEGKELVEDKISCDQLTDEQLEAVGEYLMEQMHPGELHEMMHKMMGMEEDTEYHEVFHINLAKTMYCGQNGMPMTQMMPMMQMMERKVNAGSGSISNWLTYLFYIIWLIVGILVAIWLWQRIIKKK